VNEILRSIRRQKNLSIQNVAEELGIAYSTYQAYESVDDGKIQIIELDGTDDILDAWFGKLKKINAALV
jgi:transcriptional regulator with XRE-family HTH domain